MDDDCYEWGQTCRDRQIEAMEATILQQQQEIGLRDVALAECCGLFPQRPPAHSHKPPCGCGH